jgi:hypothetical protein
MDRIKAAPDSRKISHIDIYMSDAEGAKGVSYRVDYKDGQLDLGTLARTTITKETIMSRITTNNLCRDKIGHMYMKHELYKSRMILVAYGKQQPLDKPIGFIFAHPIKKNGIYLSIICAIDVGKHLLHAFFLTSEHVFHYDYIELSALPSVLSYYPQFGFAHRPSCKKPADVRMSDELKNQIKAGIIKPNELMDEIAHVMGIQYDIVEEMIDVGDNIGENAETTWKHIAKLKKEYKKQLEAHYGNNDFLAYIQELRKHGYVADTTYVDEEGDTVMCKDSKLNIYDFIGKGCTGDGFTMRKCISRTGGAKSRKARKSKARKTRRI